MSKKTEILKDLQELCKKHQIELHSDKEEVLIIIVESSSGIIIYKLFCSITEDEIDGN